MAVGLAVKVLCEVGGSVVHLTGVDLQVFD